MSQLNSRFDEIELPPFSDEEGLEAVYTYGKLFNANLSEASALILQSLSVSVNSTTYFHSMETMR